MAKLRFFASVHLIVDGQTTEVGNVDEAIAFLSEWPAKRRGPLYDCAVRSLHSCRDGSFEVENARRGFESFARITGILARGAHALPVRGRQAPASSRAADRA